ncbi:MAG: hypothetical protein MJ211_02060, partial [Bacteroidales bacterium]|nr:hypothetical protein [Bacteroidales bacterium]
MQKHNYIQLIETLTGSQNKALSILEKCQFPTEKDEYLKNTADFADGEFVKANDFSVDKKLIDNIINNDNNSIILVFVNGLYNNDLSKNTENINFNNIIFNNKNKYSNIFELL